MQLEQREGRHDVDRIGAPLVIVIHVTTAALVTWTPPRLGTITLLQGQMVCEVEGRRYTLEPLDNVVIPRHLAHHSMNRSTGRPAEKFCRACLNREYPTSVPAGGRAEKMRFEKAPA